MISTSPRENTASRDIKATRLPICKHDSYVTNLRKKVFIKTYGCQMNVYDSERMIDILAPIGYAPTEQLNEADMVILNTCHIREKAAEKIYSELGRIHKIKQQSRPHMQVAVVGCVAQAQGDEIMRRAPVVDMVLGPQTYHKLPEMIARINRTQGQVLETEFDTQEKFDSLPVQRMPKGYSAFLTVQEGCDKFCTFCVVPYTRGPEISRPVEQIMTESRTLAAQGVREITLIGQNVNAYHGQNVDGRTWGLGTLIRHIAQIREIERIRFTTSHPRDMDDELIRTLGEEAKLMPYLHLPVQSGSDKILRHMNRGHSYMHYRKLIDKVRKSRPDIALSGDFIVGFPGETDADFEQTLNCVHEIGYASAFSFKYSSRPGTPAAGLSQQVPETVKSERLKALQSLLFSQQQAFNQNLIGRKLPVLIENHTSKTNQLFGRSPYLQGTHFQGTADLIGQIRMVTITAAGKNSLMGHMS